MDKNANLDKMTAELCAWLTSQQADKKARAQLARKLFDAVTEALLQDETPVDFLSAPNAVLEVVDQTTGRLYRRYLELEYEENDNGIRLLGEDMAAQPVQIVFLSNAALKKMHDLQGAGPDTPRCEEH